jgi:hypothetical protein
LLFNSFKFSQAKKEEQKSAAPVENDCDPAMAALGLPVDFGSKK